MRKIEKNGGGALRGSWMPEDHGEEEGRSRMERKEEDKVLEGWRRMDYGDWRRMEKEEDGGGGNGGGGSWRMERRRMEEIGRGTMFV